MIYFNKQFINITSYSRNKINRHIDHTIKKLCTKEIQFSSTQVQLTISNSTDINSIGPDCINIRHLKHLLTHIIFITHYQNTMRENTFIICNRKLSNHFSSTWIQTYTLYTHYFSQHLPPNQKRFQLSKASTTHYSCSFGHKQGI